MRGSVVALALVALMASACQDIAETSASHTDAAATTIAPLTSLAAATATPTTAPPTVAGTATESQATVLPAAATTPAATATPRPATTAPTPATPSPAPTTPAPSTPTPSVAPSASPLATIVVGGITFAFATGSRADVYLEEAFSQKAQAQSEIEIYAARIETNFGRPFARRPKIYVFASDASYTLGVSTIFGGTAGASSGLTFGSDRIAAKGYQVVMHELTHVMIGQIAPARVPSWLNEGTAYLDHWLADSPEFLWSARYHVASSASLGSLQSLTTCATTNTRACALGVEMLRADLGRAAFIRLFELIGAGSSLDSAYAQIAGKPLADFIAALPARARALAPSYPGLAMLPGVDYAGRQGLYWALYGFPARSIVTMTAAGTTHALCGASTQQVVGDDGAADSFCPVPPGTWTVEVRWSGGVVTSTARVP